MQVSQSIGHADVYVPGVFSGVAVREDEGIGFAHLCYVDVRDVRVQGLGLVHRFDEFIGDDGVTGVGRMNAIQREQSSHEVGGQRPAADHRALSGEIVDQRIDVHQGGAGGRRLAGDHGIVGNYISTDV